MPQKFSWLIQNGETRHDRLVNTVAASQAEFFKTRENIVFLIYCHCSFDTVVLNSIAKIYCNVIVQFDIETLFEVFYETNDTLTGH
jgi:hypothetical protein